MKIKEATTDDWEKVRELYLTLLKKDPRAFADEYDEVSLLDKDSWVNSLEGDNRKTFVAVVDGMFVGMGKINFYKEFPETPILHKLGVLPEYRNKGIAKKLVQAREDWAKTMGAKKIRLYVIATREKVIKYTKRNGYKIIQTLKNDIQRNNGAWEDVLLMEKEFE